MNYSFIIIALGLCVLSIESFPVTETRCEEADLRHCLNGSKCVLKTLFGSRHVMCMCPQWFYGNRCQYDGSHLQEHLSSTRHPHRHHHHHTTSSPVTKPHHRHCRRHRIRPINVTKPCVQTLVFKIIKIFKYLSHLILNFFI